LPFINPLIISNNIFEADGPATAIYCFIAQNIGVKFNLIGAGTDTSDNLTNCNLPDSLVELNITGTPNFVDPENGDFHLLPNSPAIDAGDPTSDYSLEPSGGGGRINMGAYGNTPEATLKGSEAILSNNSFKGNSKTWAYPNPFKNKTQINFNTPKHGLIKVLNLDGKALVSYNASNKSTFVWDGKNNKGNLLPSGIYLIEAELDGKITRSKAILAR